LAARVGFLQGGDFAPLEVPVAIRNDPAFATLGYKVGDAPRGVRFDLNRDGVDDYIVVGSPELCGTGGCPLQLFDGKTDRNVGQAFGDPTSGHFSWHELMAGDLETAFRFYSQLVGWQKTDAIASPMGTYQMYGKGGRTFGGMATKPKDYPAPPHWLYSAFALHGK